MSRLGWFAWNVASKGIKILCSRAARFVIIFIIHHRRSGPGDDIPKSLGFGQPFSSHPSSSRVTHNPSGLTMLEQSSSQSIPSVRCAISVASSPQKVFMARTSPWNSQGLICRIFILKHALKLSMATLLSHWDFVMLDLESLMNPDSFRHRFSVLSSYLRCKCHSADPLW
jgi:hypothetical protein